ncbi:hypothetical protein EBESD8_32640 [Rhodococcus aetherivorans]|nr:hypothetical protein EBESD8_32640 [Rhodococcus aetherivorans]
MGGSCDTRLPANPALASIARISACARRRSGGSDRVHRSGRVNRPG